LAPDDFGLFGIALLTMSTLEAFSQGGLIPALVQRKEIDESHLHTAWTFSIIRGAVLFLILYFSAPWVAVFFESEQVTAILRTVGIASLLAGMRNTGVMFFSKELRFDRQFVYEISFALTEFIVSIAVALVLKNVWALLWGLLAGYVATLLMSYICHPFRPRLKFQYIRFAELFRFGRWVLASTMVFFVINQGDSIFVGKVLGITALGFYQMAYMLSNLPATEITNTLSRVTFPAYSIVQDDVGRLRDGYFTVLEITAFVAIPLAGGICLLAWPFTVLFLGEKWTPMVPAMQILTLLCATRSVGATYASLFRGAGYPNYVFYAWVIKLVVMICIIYPLTARWGMAGVALATTLPTFASHFYGFKKVSHVLGGHTAKGMACALWPPLLCTAVMAIGVGAMKGFATSDIFSFSLTVLVGGVIYVACILLISAFFRGYNPMGKMIHIAKQS
jgi:O-antigen/teichoic acid export membrane protein